jgi:hypothetical protein
MTKQLNLPITIRCAPNDLFAVIEGTINGKTSFVRLNGDAKGSVFEDCYATNLVIGWIEDGTYTVFGDNPITDVPEPKEPTILSLKIETDASDLTNSLRQANEEATKLSNTLRGIKEFFNNEVN